MTISLDEMHGWQPHLDPILLFQLLYFVDVSFHGIFLGSPFQLIPGIPLGLAFEVQHPRPFCIYVAHSCLFVAAVDEQHLIICWLGLEVLNLLSSFVKLSLNAREG